MGAQTNHLIETVRLSTYNICFGLEIRTLFFNYALLSKSLLVVILVVVEVVIIMIITVNKNTPFSSCSMFSVSCCGPRLCIIPETTWTFRKRCCHVNQKVRAKENMIVRGGRDSSNSSSSSSSSSSCFKARISCIYIIIYVTEHKNHTLGQFPLKSKNSNTFISHVSKMLSLVRYLATVRLQKLHC